MFSAINKSSQAVNGILVSMDFTNVREGMEAEHIISELKTPHVKNIHRTHASLTFIHDN
jgi:hypothetical protein